MEKDLRMSKFEKLCYSSTRRVQDNRENEDKTK